MRQGSGFGIVLGLLLGAASGAGVAYYVTHYVLDRPRRLVRRRHHQTWTWARERSHPLRQGSDRQYPPAYRQRRHRPRHALCRQQSRLPELSSQCRIAAGQLHLRGAYLPAKRTIRSVSSRGRSSGRKCPPFSTVTISTPGISARSCSRSSGFAQSRSPHTSRTGISMRR
jgi:hypothetical protein